MKLEEIVINKINSSGFKLEIDVANTLTKCGLHPYQSIYYNDPVSNVEREVDLVVTKMTEIHNSSSLFKISLIIQCKWSKKAAWAGLISKINNIQGNYGIIKSVFSEEDSSFISNLSDRVKDKLSFISKEPSFDSYMVTTVGGIDKKGDEEKDEKIKDIAYEGYRLTISAAMGVLSISKNDAIRTHKRRLYNLVIPIIIVDGPLVKVDCIDDGNCIALAADYLSVLYSAESFFRIHIMNPKKLESVVKDIASDMDQIIDDVFNNGSQYCRPGGKVTFVNRI